MVLQVKCPLFLILAETGIYQQISAKFSDIKSHEHSFSGSRVAICGQKETDGRTDG
jgi:hypothetical protein